MRSPAQSMLRACRRPTADGRPQRDGPQHPFPSPRFRRRAKGKSALRTGGGGPAFLAPCTPCNTPCNSPCTTHPSVNGMVWRGPEHKNAEGVCVSRSGKPCARCSPAGRGVSRGARRRWEEGTRAIFFTQKSAKVRAGGLQGPPETQTAFPTRAHQIRTKHACRIGSVHARHDA